MSIAQFTKEVLRKNLRMIKRRWEVYKKNDQWKCKGVNLCRKEILKGMYKEYCPVFMITTGRSGTKFLSKVADRMKNVESKHEPNPTLRIKPKFAFSNRKKEQILAKVFESAREEKLLKTYIENKTYIETNHCLSFFSRGISKTLEKAKFIHLIRNPKSFVRSGVKNGWYKSDTVWEYGRPKKTSEWKNMPQISKLAWLWDITNIHAEKMKKELDDERTFTIKSENLFESPKAIKKLAAFVGAKIKIDEAKQLQKKKINKSRLPSVERKNIHKKQEYPRYCEWREKEKKNFLEQLTTEEKYDYEI